MLGIVLSCVRLKSHSSLSCCPVAKEYWSRLLHSIIAQSNRCPKGLPEIVFPGPICGVDHVQTENKVDFPAAFKRVSDHQTYLSHKSWQLMFSFPRSQFRKLLQEPQETFNPCSAEGWNIFLNYCIKTPLSLLVSLTIAILVNCQEPWKKDLCIPRPIVGHQSLCCN